MKTIVDEIANEAMSKAAFMRRNPDSYFAKEAAADALERFAAHVLDRFAEHWVSVASATAVGFVLGSAVMAALALVFQ